jgi:hypothetical protein
MFGATQASHNDLLLETTQAVTTSLCQQRDHTILSCQSKALSVCIVRFHVLNRESTGTEKCYIGTILSVNTKNSVGQDCHESKFCFSG